MADLDIRLPVKLEEPKTSGGRWDYVIGLVVSSLLIKMVIILFGCNRTSSTRLYVLTIDFLVSWKLIRNLLWYNGHIFLSLFLMGMFYFLTVFVMVLPFIFGKNITLVFRVNLQQASPHFSMHVQRLTWLKLLHILLLP